MRVLSNQIDRATWRNTLAYRLFPRLTVGVEYNPLDGDVGPLVNFVAVTETEKRPALILGTSSDRIGTPEGRSFYATFSKDLTESTGLPIAPYVGYSYGQFDASVGSFFAPLRGVASAGVLAPGGLALAVVVALACAVARPGSRRVLVIGAGIIAASVVVLVAAELLWLRYFLPLSVAGAGGVWSMRAPLPVQSLRRKRPHADESLPWVQARAPAAATLRPWHPGLHDGGIAAATRSRNRNPRRVIS